MIDFLFSQILSQGFAVVRGLLSQEQSRYYKTLLQKVTGIYDEHFPRSYSKGDFIAQNETFWDLIFEPKILETAEAAIGEKAKWIQQADVHINVSTSLHRDCVDRNFGEGPNWDESVQPYRLIRFAIYLQSSDSNHSRFVICPESHRRSTKQRIQVTTDVGDCVVFDARMLHGSTRVKGPKYGLFLCYGASNGHSRRHAEWFLHARKEDLGYRPVPAKLKKRLRKHDLDI